LAQLVLLVEDEQKLREMLRSYLEREGLGVVSTGSGAEAITYAERLSPGLVILDLGLPDVPGEEVLRELRSDSDAPILVLTAKSAAASKILSFELGADDYVTKPFDPRELVLRAKAILSRGRASAGGDSLVSLGNGVLVIDEGRREVFVQGQAVHLTRSEWGLLTTLAVHPGRVYSRAELINRIRGYEFRGYERNIDTHVKNLRHKIEADPQSPRIIETVLGSGYRLGLTRDG
jgi:DNA-binding response OmpR family regulator